LHYIWAIHNWTKLEASSHFNNAVYVRVIYSSRSYRIPRYCDPKFLWYWIYNWQFVIETLFNINFFSSCYNFLVILLLCQLVTAHIWGSDWRNARRNTELITEFHLGDISVHSKLIMKHLPDISCESMDCLRLSAAKEIPYINNHFLFLYSPPYCTPRCCQQSHFICSGTDTERWYVHFRVRKCCIGSLCKNEFVHHGKWVGPRKQNEVLDSGDSCESLPVVIKRVTVFLLCIVLFIVLVLYCVCLWRTCCYPNWGFSALLPQL
jgi:hypothetical protein